MNVLMIGSGSAGSWQMRGVQLGAAIGARVTTAPTNADLSWADVIVLVKRAIMQHGRLAAKAGKPMVWDALDFWSQPAQNTLGRASAIAAAMAHVKDIQPSLIVCATQAMATDLGGFYLPHHGYRGLAPMAARSECCTVAYDGNAAYLDRWATVLRRACEARGWSFVVNPTDLSTVDILVSLRGGVWDGWICREWKSGVKVVNALLAGRPIITQDCAPAREIQPAGSVIESDADLEAALDRWADADLRRAVAEQCVARAPMFSLESLALAYKARLQALCAVGVS